mgnify:CR=1 FL=1
MGACRNEWGQDGKKEGLTKWMDRWVHVEMNGGQDGKNEELTK